MKRTMLIALCASVGLVVAGCSDIRDQQVRTEQSESIIGDTSLCDFHLGHCTNGSMTVNVSPANAPSEQPLTISIELPIGHQVQNAQIEGRDMFMGVVPVSFIDGKATAIYGSCSSDYMVWRMTLSVADQHGELQQHHFDWLADNSAD